MTHVQRMYEAFQQALKVNVSYAASRQAPLHLPVFSESQLIRLCREVTNEFMKDDILLHLDSPIVIVGDLHGHFLDLIRIFQNCGQPPDTKFLFLGDLIDRGEFSLETITLIFVLKVLFPSCIYVIRGNHEFESLAETYNFKSCLDKLYPESLVFKAIFDAFSYLPLAAIIDDETLCVHGGIGPFLTTVSDIKQLERPINRLNDEVLINMLWSDPSDTVNGFEPSPRKIGCLYSQEALFKFLLNSNLCRIIRGHSYAYDGIQKDFGDRCITVFSASNYIGSKKNQSAVFMILQKGKDEIKLFPPLDYILRGCAKFFQVEEKASSSFDVIKRDEVPLNNHFRRMRVRSFTSVPNFHRSETPKQITPFASGYFLKISHSKAKLPIPKLK